MEDWEARDQQNFIVKHLTIQPQEKSIKKKKENTMNEHLKNAIEYATNNKANEMGAEIGAILQQKIEAELKSLKVDIAKDTYNFDTPVTNQE